MSTVTLKLVLTYKKESPAQSARNEFEPIPTCRKKPKQEVEAGALHLPNFFPIPSPFLTMLPIWSSTLLPSHIYELEIHERKENPGC